MFTRFVKANSETKLHCHTQLQQRRVKFESLMTLTNGETKRNELLFHYRKQKQKKLYQSINSACEKFENIKFTSANDLWEYLFLFLFWFSFHIYTSHRLSSKLCRSSCLCGLCKQRFCLSVCLQANNYYARTLQNIIHASFISICIKCWSWWRVKVGESTAW